MSEKHKEARLQLRWQKGEKINEWLCHYELILPLGEYDVRRDQHEQGFIALPIKEPTVRTATQTPCLQYPSNEPYADTPFRDGAHAIWDSQKLGDLPIYVIGLDGTEFLWETEKDQA